MRCNRLLLLLQSSRDIRNIKLIVFSSRKTSFTKSSISSLSFPSNAIEVVKFALSTVEVFAIIEVEVIKSVLAEVDV